MKLPLPYCLFLNNPASHPFLGLKRGKGNRKTQEKTEKNNQKFGSTEQSTYLCTRFSPTNVK